MGELSFGWMTGEGTLRWKTLSLLCLPLPDKGVMGIRYAGVGWGRGSLASLFLYTVSQLGVRGGGG